MKKFKRTLYFPILTLITDSIAFFLSYCVTFWIRFHSGLFSAPRGIPPFSDYLKVFPVLLLIFILVFKFFNLYRERHFFESGISGRQISKAYFFSILMFLLLSYFYRETTYSRLYLILFVPIGYLSILILRKAELSLEKWMQKKLLRKNSLVVIGIDDEINNFSNTLQSKFNWGIEKIVTFNIKDYLHKEEKLKELESRFEQWKKQDKINEIIIATKDIPSNKLITLIYLCEKYLFSYYFIPDIFNIIASNVDIINIDGYSILEVRRSPLDKLHNRIIKRSIDIIGSLAGIIIFSPAMLIIAYLIKKDSPGPVLYKQERLGEDGKIFTLYKFRTMIADAEKQTGPVFASESDPRRTKIGKWLRSKNLDELPQLFNVLKGDMSLVGPRPERPHFVNKFKDNIPRYMARHTVKSGMTGWAQIHGLRGNTSIEERVKYDLYYIENWSVFLDLKIILLSFFSNKNAY